MAEKKKRYVSDNAQLMAEWNWAKNRDFDPSQLTCWSNKKVWWVCNKGHEWEATISHRSNGTNCPYCSNQKVLKNYNDLQTINPTLAKEWNYNKNTNITPDSVVSNSKQKVWWMCNKGHEWEATVGDRNRGSGCPICHSERHTSFPEYAIVYYLTKYGIEVIHSHKIQGYELDVYIPSLRTAIEYDGFYWHKNKQKKDLAKNRQCEKEKIKLYRIREGLPSLNDTSIDYVIQDNQDELSNALEEILMDIIGHHIDVNPKRDAIEIENLREYTEKENSLLFSNPQLALEWNYMKNGNLKPENITINSNKRVWWKCNKDHEWMSTVHDRNTGCGCPFCSNKKILKGYNDLQTVNPELTKEWNYDKNGSITPDSVGPNSTKKVWWKCNNGHEWQARISNRNHGTDCPFCAGLYVIEGDSDLLTINPNLAKQWNYEKNKILTPKNIKPNSGKKVWWKCDKGHEWQDTVAHRNKDERGCPYCSNKRVLIGYNDLQTINPILTKEWNFEKNESFYPNSVTVNSGKKAWWKCSKGHEWQARIADRNRGRGCPYCSGKIAIGGHNDLEAINPFLAKEWNYNKNNTLKPFDVLPNSSKKIWWTCDKGHEWRASIANRSKGRGCPYCSNHKILIGYNDLQTINPNLANEWNYNKNGKLNPTDVTAGSGKKVWWKCINGHEWEDTVSHRNNGRTCPICNRENHKN